MQVIKFKTLYKQIFLTHSDLFKEYKAYCLQNHLQAGGRDLFSRLFSEKNLSIFSPRKDQCNLCCAHKEGNISDSEYLDHVAKKNATQLEKDKDKE